MRFTREEIQRETRAILLEEGQHHFFEGVAIDSRDCREGQLFFALKGKRTDGHLFLPDAFQKGAWGALVQAIPVFWRSKEGPVLFQVEDTHYALQDIGQRASQRLKGKKVAITGTVGKTTCKHFLRALLGERFRVEVTPHSFNTLIGVSCALANFQEEDQLVVVEAGISEKGEMEKLARIIVPEIVVFTSFGEGHLQGLGSVEEVVKEKEKLVCPETHCIYLNGDLVESFRLRQNFQKEGKRVISFGRNRGNDMFLSRFDLQLSQWQARCSIQWGQRITTFRTPILFPEVVVSLLPAIHLAFEWGVAEKEVIETLQSFQVPSGRGNILFCSGGVVIDDSYNANPLSYRKAIKLLKEAARYGFETWLVAGDMLELGDISLQEHRRLLQELVKAPSLAGVVIFGYNFMEAS
ncbi:MAG: UDP-N-acetylmuramoyl-tripeptide--D-alanyl-D-alanine ligase [Candidatus Caldatribacteriaceae bacterium]